MQEEVEVLHAALRDIAHAVVQDSEGLDVETIQRASHVHLAPSTPVPQKYEIFILLTLYLYYIFKTKKVKR